MDISKIWSNDPETIKKFQDQLPKYTKLSEEISFILKEKLKEKNIKFSSVSYRTKTLESFLEKIINRKKYADPFSDVTDFDGVRLVYLYLDDLEKIKELISEEFKVDPKNTSDKSKDVETGELPINKFGYNGINFIVNLSDKYFGARYNDIKDLSCEIQVRSISQDVWSVMDHDLIYKKEAEIPIELRRKVNALSATLEVVDNFFNIIKNEKESYINSLKEVEADLLKKDLTNIDNFIAFLTKDNDTSSIDLEKLKNVISSIYSILVKINKYKTVGDLKNILDSTKDLRDRFYIETKDIYNKTFETSILNQLLLSLTLIDKDFRDSLFPNENQIKSPLKEFIERNNETPK